MNRKNLTSAVLAGLAGAAGIASTAQAVNLNPDGLGQILIYPYYTVNQDAEGRPNFTAMSIVNTTNDAKAVKVRFLEGANSQEVLDFNLYMSAYDVWTASIEDREDPKDGQNKPHLVTFDNSCTVPYLWLLQNGNPDLGGPPPEQPSGQPFLPFDLTDEGNDSENPFDYEPINPRGREGHVEVIEMGVLTNYAPPDPVTGIMGSARAATHVAKSATGVPLPPEIPADPNSAVWEPEDCAQLNDAWITNSGAASAYWGGLAGDPYIDMAPPTGGLFGGASVVNAVTGFMVSYDAKAINGWNDSRTIGDAPFETPDNALHQNPGSTLPDLDSGNNLVATVFLDNGTTEVFDFETASNPETRRAVDAISFLFMHDRVINEYSQQAFPDAKTEWVMTFPTRQFYVYEPRSGSEDPVAPFTTVWEEQPNGRWGACERVFLGFAATPQDDPFRSDLPPRPYYDQEERYPFDPVDPDRPTVSPRPPIEEPEPNLFELCFETSVIEFIRGDQFDDDVGTPLPPLPPRSQALGSQNVTRVDTAAATVPTCRVIGPPTKQPDAGDCLPSPTAPFRSIFDGGWTQVLLDRGVDDNGSVFPRQPLGSLLGLPITGFSVKRFGTEGLIGGGEGSEGFRARYGGIFQHKGSRLKSSGES